MVEIIQGISFGAIRVSQGWCVVIISPNGGRVEIHDFQSEAGAKAWIKVNARQWAADYSKNPSERPMMSN
jgi:hypothetical protein